MGCRSPMRLRHAWWQFSSDDGWRMEEQETCRETCRNTPSFTVELLQLPQSLEPLHHRREQVFLGSPALEDLQEPIVGEGPLDRECHTRVAGERPMPDQQIPERLGMFHSSNGGVFHLRYAIVTC